MYIENSRDSFFLRVKFNCSLRSRRWNMLQVNEIFGPTIQGEGKNAGKEVVFLRLACCNLYCIWCDTPYTWNWKNTSYKHPEKYDKKKEIHRLSDEEILDKIEEKEVKSIVISGGEPLLQQKQLTGLLSQLKMLGYYIEIETNGTIPVRPEVMELVDQFNCSPKLTSSKVEVKKRIIPYVLVQLARSGKANFKFVIGSPVDLAEARYLVRTYKLEEVYLMSEGRTIEELKEKEEWLKKFCNKHKKFHFSQRLHITELGGGRGV